MLLLVAARQAVANSADAADAADAACSTPALPMLPLEMWHAIVSVTVRMVPGTNILMEMAS